jgi:predicted O-linked N-acetylglucosamine transferase (SPINDLY family)
MSQIAQRHAQRHAQRATPRGAAAAPATAQKARRHWEAGRRHAQARQWHDAVREFEAATALAPRDALYALNLARALIKCGLLAGGEEAARRALLLEPGNALAQRLLADTLMAQNRHAEASQAFATLEDGTAHDADFYADYGNALYLARRPAEAVQAYLKALAQRIDFPVVHYRLGLAFKDMNLREEAAQCFRTAIALDTGSLRAMSLALLVHERRQACDWDGLEADTAQLLEAIDHLPPESGHLLSPFALLAIEATPAQQLQVGRARTHGLTHHVKPLPPVHLAGRRPGRIRVGYLSADFNRHATAVLMAEMLELRDTGRFEVTLYSHSSDDDAPITRRIRAACEHFVDVSALSNEAVARRMRADGIDIAVDLKGHTRDSRFEILAARPAPVQVGWLGYPASTGAPFLDYLVGDAVVTPLEHADRYSEHIAQLPHSYQPNDRQRPLPAPTPRAALGLPADAVVLACFNQAYKISAAMLDLWARILHGAPKAMLWLLAWNAHAEQRLLEQMVRRGIARERVAFAPRRSLDDHIARLRAADLFLDTWPCNAHTTASEALWAGVPVLTVPGPTFASRVAASLVHACGQGELACASEDAYVQRAIALANRPAELAALKADLDTRRLALPLFDTPRFTRDYEALLQRMFDRSLRGEAPAALPALPGGTPG